jgi:carboxypeptidase D
MFGVFLENGPLRVSKTDTSFEVTAAELSWAHHYHVIYVDQPVNTGFSYADKSLTDMKDGAEEFVKFMKKFFEMHSDLKNNELYLSGESYAGKYLSLFTKTILTNNDEETEDGNKLNLKSTIIFDPIASPIMERTNMDTTPYALNIIDDVNARQVETLK